jgi:hypothetical protein
MALAWIISFTVVSQLCVVQLPSKYPGTLQLQFVMYFKEKRTKNFENQKK